MPIHTPGPWRLAHSPLDDEPRSVVGGDDSLICRMEPRYPLTQYLTYDASLITAAPDMLAALELIVDAAEDGDDPEVIVLARVAIAKARGE